MKTETSPGGPVESAFGPTIGLLGAAVKAQRLMDRAALLSEMALIAGIEGRESNAKVFSREAAKLREQAAAVQGPFVVPKP